MKISVAIPTCNSAASIRATIDSVLQQTRPADEVLIVDDGSTDQTIEILKQFGSRIAVVRQQNGGVASTRNHLCKLVSGDVVAFVDHDDIWHPRYLEIQSIVQQRNPNAVASFTGHVNFYGNGSYAWQVAIDERLEYLEVISAVEFLRRYNVATGPFGSMSYCCVRREALGRLGPEPFRVDGVDDSHLCNALCLLNRPFVFCDAPLVAYRITERAQSADRLKTFGRWVQSFELLRPSFESSCLPALKRVFLTAFAAKKRSFGKYLMGADRIRCAREEFIAAFHASANLKSSAKSLGLLCSTYLPTRLQPVWPDAKRGRDGEVIPARVASSH